MSYAYITLLTDDSYFNGVLMLNDSLKQVQSKYPLYCMVAKEKVSYEIIRLLKKAQIPIINVENIEFPQFTQYNLEKRPEWAMMWQNCCTKFQLWTLQQFDKIVYIDADICVLQNIDDLFNYSHLSACVDGEAQHLSIDGHFNSGLFICEPNIEEYYQLLNFCNNYNFENKNQIGDQDILNDFFGNWPNEIEKHISPYYNMLAPHIEDYNDLLNNGRCLHFVGQKPWNTDWKQFDMTFPELYEDAARYLNDIKNDLASSLTVGVYGIVKNESTIIERCLDAVKNADQICILDTGSTDDTYLKLQNLQTFYPQLVIKQQAIEPFRFDSARNQSLQLLSSDIDICISIDADDIFPQNWKQIVQEDFINGYNKIIGGYQYYQNENPIGLPIHLDRVGWNGNVYWQGALHEHLVNKDIDRSITDPRFLVQHRQKSNENFSYDRQLFYYNIAKNAYLQDPTNSWNMVVYGYEAANQRQFQEAAQVGLRLFQQEINNPINLTRKFIEYVIAQSFKELGREDLWAYWLEKSLLIDNKNSLCEDFNLYNNTIEKQLQSYYLTHGYNSSFQQLKSPVEYSTNWKVGIYSICKNESKHILRWLETYKNADQIVIIDTGSEDGTWQLLQSYQKLYPNLYIEQRIYNPFHFGAAKTYALNCLRKLSHSTKWIYCNFDLDEFCEQDIMPILKEVWSEDCEITAIIAKLPDQPDFYCMVNQKIHSDSIFWYWGRPVHEVLSKAHQNLDNHLCEFNILDLTNRISYRHEQDHDKKRNYKKILENHLQQDPNNVSSMGYLVGEYLLDKSLWDKARELVKKYDSLTDNHDNPFLWELFKWYHIVLETDEKLKRRYALELLKYMKDHDRVSRFYIQYIEPYVDDPYEKIQLLETELTLDKNQGHYRSDDEVYCHLCILYYWNARHNQDYKTSLYYAQKAYDENPSDLNKTNLIYCQNKVQEINSKVVNKVAIYTICKNELKFVDKWYESMKEADLIAVLDTGSTDGTWERLQEIAAQDPRFIIAQKIITPWRFDVARNESLKLVPRDYNILMSTDLDELLDPGWAQPIRDKWIEGVHERGEYMYAWSHDGSGNPGRVFTYNKIHSWNWIWKYPVHELLWNIYTHTENYENGQQLYFGFDVYLHHYPDTEKSRGSYLPLLELRASENPEDFYGLIYLGHEYSYRGIYEKSNEILDKCLQHKDASGLIASSCYLFKGDNYRKLNQDDLAKESYLKSIELTPDYREPYLNLADILISNKQYKEAIQYIQQALHNGVRHYSWLERDSSWSYQPYDLLSLAYFYSGEKEKSFLCAYKAWNLNKEDERLKHNLDIIAEVLEKENNF